MKPPPFDYAAPRTVAEATAALASADGGAKVLAGGQSLIPLLNMRLIAPTTVVDINGVAGLDHIDVGADGVAVGATVRQRDLEHDPAALAANPLLAAALPWIAHPVIRNRGTVVGSIIHADPAAELPAVLALTGGAVTLTAADGTTRRVDASAFFLGPLEADVRTGELATEVRFDRVPPRAGAAVVEMARRHGDYAVCGIAALVEPHEDGSVARARVATIGVNPTPLVIDVTEPVVAGDLTAAGELVASRISPDADLHASTGYRRHLAAVLTARGLSDAAERAGGAA